MGETPVLSGRGEGTMPILCPFSIMGRDLGPLIKGDWHRGIVWGIVSEFEAKKGIDFFGIFLGGNNADQPLKISFELF
jgi:hypothetical protein